MRSKHSRSAILAQSAALLAVMLISTQALAFPVDTIGGPGSDAQTVGHCGIIPLEPMVYTNESRNVAILQRKLTKLGYFRGAIDGKNSPWFKTAVAKFQFDYGLKIDGVIGQETAQAIVYLGHPIRNVRACKRELAASTYVY
ncbi:MAG: peptidoglycan-binding domain-containing protein [Rickettsiales bacterium]